MNAPIDSRGSVTLGEATRVFARIGILSFGGPAGQIALMHRVIVEEKGWLDEARFLHALNYCMLLPGPEAMQLAIYSGWLLHGVRGGLVAGLLFILPGAFVITTLSAIYLQFGHVPLIQGLLLGMKAAVLAVVLEALIRMSRRSVRHGFALALAMAGFVAIAFLRLPFPLIILGAVLCGALMALDATDDGKRSEAAAEIPEWARPSLGRFLKTSAIWLAIWLLPLMALSSMSGTFEVFAAEALFFSKMAAVTFGGAYAVLAYVAQQAVEVHHWLLADEMLTGLGLAETTPGPLILVLVFVGFLGGARLSGLDPLTGGVTGAVVTLWFTFVPCFLWIFAGAPYVETVRNVRWLASALAAVTAVVVGIIANLALWFALHVLFGVVRDIEVGPFIFAIPDLPTFDPGSMLIALAAGIALIVFRANLIAVLAAAALAGMGWKLAMG
ncbi:chromate efflux transporter [Mesorhizobium sp. 1B3]|uniref:chromate efflux transporter n=1 Tax=Mesorhizobium sp. 1B3 TaxID=3243599 RepID=UPI003D96E2BE